jgi:capsule polysaccharide export protein KpsE/RkpR
MIDIKEKKMTTTKKLSSASSTLTIVNHMLMFVIFLSNLFLATVSLLAFKPMTRVSATVTELNQLTGCSSNKNMYDSTDYVQRFVVGSEYAKDYKKGATIDVYIPKHSPSEPSIQAPLYMNLGYGLFLLFIDLIILVLYIARFYS